METLKSLAIATSIIAYTLQSCLWCVDRSHGTFWTSYCKSWGRTFVVMSHLAGIRGPDGKQVFISWAVVLCCLPGVLLVGVALSKFGHP